VRTLAQLMATLETVRETGYATNFEESEEGVGSVAIALRDRTGKALAAVAVAIPTSRLNQCSEQGYRRGPGRRRGAASRPRCRDGRARVPTCPACLLQSGLLTFN